jgi:hypothetical protein
MNNHTPKSQFETGESLPGRKTYTAPTIIHELELETRAGSPAPTLEPIIPGEDEILQP